VRIMYGHPTGAGWALGRWLRRVGALGGCWVQLQSVEDRGCSSNRCRVLRGLSANSLYTDFGIVGGGDSEVWARRRLAAATTCPPGLVAAGGWRRRCQ
jgi:hypothetical protein